MADNYNRFRGSGSQALNALLKAADRGFDTMRKVRIEIDPDQVQRIVVWTPEEPQDADAAGPPDLVMRTPPVSAAGLETALPLLLLQGGSGPLAEPDADVLFVGRILPMDELVPLVRELERFASPAQIALPESPEGPLCLIHVLDDTGRLSGLGGLKALGMFRDWDELKCFSRDRIRLFLPEDLRTPESTFDAFCDLVSRESVARLLRLTPQGPEGDIFYIVNRASGDSRRFHVLLLPPSAFVDTTEVGTSALGTVRIVPLTGGPDPGRLADTIWKEAGDVGYRLRLRTSTHRGEVELELEKLRMKRAEVDQRIAHLATVQQPRPYLLRFGPEQLRALAETIYAFSVEALSEDEGDVRYAFQANRHAPGGYHYLLVGPHTFRRELDPLHLYDNHPHIRFWLDPSWARYYPDTGNTCYVFVPEHTALSPSLHSWHREDMDRHLRNILEERWRAASGGDALPEEAYYVFDLPSDDADTVNLTILAASDFVAPRMRLQWISDNVTVAGRVRIEDYVSGTADSLGWERIAESAALNATHARESFEAAVETTRNLFAAELDLMVRQIKEGTDGVITQIEGLIPQVAGLDAQLTKLVNVRQRVGAAVGPLGNLLKKLNERARAFSDEFEKVEKDMEAALVRASQVAEVGNQRVIRLLDEWKRKRQALMDELEVLRTNR